MGMHLKNANDRPSTKVNTGNAYLPTTGSWDFFGDVNPAVHLRGQQSRDELDQITR